MLLWLDIKINGGGNYEINAIVHEYVVSNDGWEGTDDNNKPGFSALKQMPHLSWNLRM